MKCLPEFAEVQRIAATGQYDVLPVSCELLSDFTTPIETMKILKNVSTHCYLLESALANEKWGRYTFLGFDPKLEVKCIDGELRAGNFKIHTDNPSDYLRQILADYKSPRFDYLPSFPAVWWATSPTTTWPTASHRSSVRWRTVRRFRMWT